MHLAAGEVAPASYQAVPQVRGNELHAAIDDKRYSNRKNILQGASIYSEELQVQGKLDTYDTSTGELVERKARIKKIHEGNLMQLYAEYFCLIEMGFNPKKLAFYSMQDNKKYPVSLPGKTGKQRLKEIIANMQNYTTKQLLNHTCPNCSNNIYNPLNW